MPEQLFLPPEYLNWPYTSPDQEPAPPVKSESPYDAFKGSDFFSGQNEDKANDRDDYESRGRGGSFGANPIDMTTPLAQGLNAFASAAFGPIGVAPGIAVQANNVAYVNNVREQLGLPELPFTTQIGAYMPFGMVNDLGSGSPETDIGDVTIGGKTYGVSPGGMIGDRTTLTPDEARRRQQAIRNMTADQLGDMALPTAPQSTNRATPPSPRSEPSTGGGFSRSLSASEAREIQDRADREDRDRDRELREGRGSGASPRRGDVSNAGR